MTRFILHGDTQLASCTDCLSRVYSDKERLYEVLIQEHDPKRSLDQNSKLWAMLDDVAKQVEWYGQKLGREDWKQMFTASLKKQKAVPGIDGGFVVLGVPTSSMSKKLMSELIELIYAFGAERNVIWSEP